MNKEHHTYTLFTQYELRNKYELDTESTNAQPSQDIRYQVIMRIEGIKHTF
jgi:hypothetical protein